MWSSCYNLILPSPSDLITAGVTLVFLDFLPAPGPERRHPGEENGHRRGCVRVHEAAAAGAGGVGQVHPRLLRAPPG